MRRAFRESTAHNSGVEQLFGNIAKCAILPNWRARNIPSFDRAPARSIDINSGIKQAVQNVYSHRSVARKVTNSILVWAKEGERLFELKMHLAAN